jgi:hypothetical protein
MEFMFGKFGDVEYGNLAIKDVSILFNLTVEDILKVEYF